MFGFDKPDDAIWIVIWILVFLRYGEGSYLDKAIKRWRR
jgi:hypothetical protein